MYALGYTYQAEIMCAAHAAIEALRTLPDRHEISGDVIGRLSHAALDAEHANVSDRMRAEIAHHILAELAPLAEIADWGDLSSFDSDAFPKPIDHYSISDLDYCESCGMPISGNGVSRDATAHADARAQSTLENLAALVTVELRESAVISDAFGIAPSWEDLEIRVSEIIAAQIDASRKGETVADAPTLTYYGMPSLRLIAA